MPTIQLQCDAAVSDLVLQAARAAMPKNPGDWIQHAGIKNSPLLDLLDALLDATKAVAAAVADNAWDDCRPLEAGLAAELAKQAQSIASDITSATQCSSSPD